jgi:hypothetical protein
MSVFDICQLWAVSFYDTMPQSYVLRDKIMEVIQTIRQKGYSKCGAFIGYLARHSNIKTIPKECQTCPQLSNCALPV